MAKQRREFKGNTIATGSYSVFVCPTDHVHIHLTDPEVHVVFDPEEAYEFAQAILRGYDLAAAGAPYR